MNISSFSRRQFHATAAVLAGSTFLGGSLKASQARDSNTNLVNPGLGRDDVWYGWRGPGGNNIAADGATIPDQIGPENIRWATPVPGRGHSSPIVTEDKIFLTTAHRTKGLQSVLGFDRNTGKPSWEQIIHRGGLPTENHPKNTEASSTLAFDGENLFAVFYNSKSLWLTSIGPDGTIRWQENLGTYNPMLYKYGYAASPLLYKNSVIVVADYDGQPFLTARDRASGKMIWKVARPVTISFSSPICAQTSGRDQIILSGGNKVISYDPVNGKTLWEVEATTMATCGTAVWDDDQVYVSGGYPKKETVAIRTDGSGKIVWSNNQKCYEQSILLHEGFVYAATDSGVAYCWRASDGEQMWRERLGGDYSSSPVLVGSTIHVFNEQGEGFAFKASSESFKLLGRNQLADDVFPTPSIVGDKMYMRFAKRQGDVRQEYLACIA